MATKELVLEEIFSDIKSPKVIVLYNDDVNTFSHVIECLIRICEHSSEQAEQASLIVHFRGKCSVKTGEEKVLKQKCLALLDQGLSAKIE
jgi:ATP-dependent Clp protease adaptor protein ClpS